MDKVRARVLISGKVQGVNFRTTCRDQARSVGVGGWVKNLPTGTVEAVFEGSQAGVQRMINWCYSGPSHAHVDHVETSWEQPTEREWGFDIVW